MNTSTGSKLYGIGDLNIELLVGRTIFQKYTHLLNIKFTGYLLVSGKEMSYSGEQTDLVSSFMSSEKHKVLSPTTRESHWTIPKHVSGQHGRKRMITLGKYSRLFPGWGFPGGTNVKEPACQ